MPYSGAAQGIVGGKARFAAGADARRGYRHDVGSAASLAASDVAVASQPDPFALDALDAMEHVAPVGGEASQGDKPAAKLLGADGQEQDFVDTIAQERAHAAPPDAQAYPAPLAKEPLGHTEPLAIADLLHIFIYISETSIRLSERRAAASSGKQRSRATLTSDANRATARQVDSWSTSSHGRSAHDAINAA